jgi:hypothetical protein
VIWRLAQGDMRLTPAQVEEMTIGDIEICLDSDHEKRRGPEGFTPMSPLEMAEHARRRREMTLRERLARARSG